MGAKSYEELAVWQKAHQLVLDVYRITRPFPREEVYGLTSQLRRSAASVAANIVEGFRRPTRSDKARFYQMALASLDESHYPSGSPMTLTTPILLPFARGSMKLAACCIPTRRPYSRPTEPAAPLGRIA